MPFLQQFCSPAATPEQPVELTETRGCALALTRAARVLKRPAAQLAQAASPPSLVVPRAHLVQVVAAAAAEILPAAQSVHAVPPVSAANLPAAQSVHAWPATPLDLPAAQSVHAVAPAALEVPAAQVVHDCCCPAEPQNEPAAHFVHAAPALRYWPAGQSGNAHDME